MPPSRGPSSEPGYPVDVAERPSKEAVSERLAEIRQQLALLADYL
jgi:hypothetical protein